MGRPSRRAPRDWLSAGQWPTGTLSADAPPPARLARALTIRLRNALEHSSAHAAAQAAGVAHSTVSHLLHGKSWPDIDTIARLEAALDADLWGREHRQQP